MPYHLEALETSWASIDKKYQFMLSKLLNGDGYFWAFYWPFYALAFMDSFQRWTTVGCLCDWTNWFSRYIATRIHCLSSEGVYNRESTALDYDTYQLIVNWRISKFSVGSLTSIKAINYLYCSISFTP